ncbi:MAG TPA: hypothetical protein VIJ22_19385, partial [Polyangiaceae bacterium]
MTRPSTIGGLTNYDLHGLPPCYVDPAVVHGGVFCGDRKGYAANRTSSRGAGGDIAGARTLAARLKRDGRVN